MPNNDYDIGDRPTVTAEFRLRQTGDLADPSAVRVKLLEPDGTITTFNHPDPTITNPSVGIWEFTFPSAIDQDGGWGVKFYGVSGVVAAENILIPVEHSEFD